MMTPKLRLMLGVVTVGIFVFFGATMFAEGQQTLGGVVLGLGILRGMLLVQQWRAYRADDED